MNRNFIVCLILACSVSGCGPTSQSPVHQAAIDSFVKDGKPFIITGYKVHWVDTANGVDIAIGSDNVSQKVVKYVRYEVTPYNAVGDVQYSEIGNASTEKVFSTGPYPSMTTMGSYWGDVWYNGGIVCFVINRASVEFMDGSKVYYNGVADVQKIMLPGLKNSCKV